MQTLEVLGEVPVRDLEVAQEVAQEVALRLHHLMTKMIKMTKMIRVGDQTNALYAFNQ